MLAMRPVIGWIVIMLVAPFVVSAETEPPAGATPAERGLWFLLNKPYMARDVSQTVFDNMWRVWPEPLRSEAEKASPEIRRELAFRRYGFVEMPGRSEPMGFVADESGEWSMNCLACHGGKLEGKPIPGLPNSHFAMQTWAQDVVNYRVQIERQPRSRFLQSLSVPLSRSNGTTNAQIFSVVFTTLRDSDLAIRKGSDIHVPKMVHHDLDAPPFWNLKKKRMIYIDGFVEKSHRVIMQFVLLPSNKAETIKSWENDYRDVLAFAESMTPPVYPGPIDQGLASQGKVIFEANCSSCHGTYGPSGSYPEKTVPIEDVGTDRRPSRWDADPTSNVLYARMDGRGRACRCRRKTGRLRRSAARWHMGFRSLPAQRLDSDPLAPLPPRPPARFWKRTEDGYDHSKIGLEVAEFEKVPPEVRTADDRRAYFDTSLPGKSAQGHDFPNVLTDDQKKMVLEYLKSL